MKKLLLSLLLFAGLHASPTANEIYTTQRNAANTGNVQKTFVPVAGQFYSFDVSLNPTSAAIVTLTVQHAWDASATTDYIGNAPTGSSTSASVWTITRNIVASDGSVTTAHAYNVKWTDYLTATYS
jgi:hypothetical protein